MQGGTREAARMVQGGSKEVILGLLLAYGGDFRSPCDHLESSWSDYERLKVRFRETFIFPIDLNDFINHVVNSELLLHHFGVSLGSLFDV